MKTKLLALTVSIALAATAQAATLVDVWSSTTNDWAANGSTQPQWASANILTPGASQSGATILTSSHPAATTTSPAGGLYDGYFYTYLATSGFSMSINSDTVLSNIDTLSVSFLSAGSVQTTSTSTSLTLYFADTTSVVVSGASFTSTPGATLGEGTDYMMSGTNYAWTWDLSPYDASSISGFSINVTSGMHTAYDNFVLTQTSAVPEPASFAALAGLGVLASASLRRRRRG